MHVTADQAAFPIRRAAFPGRRWHETYFDDLESPSYDVTNRSLSTGDGCRGATLKPDSPHNRIDGDRQINLMALANRDHDRYAESAT
ncbi:hypothetical protein K227x_23650 [Rubripirellula lacrimiformis]|uniref:Uncharacterized protein n=1 Tax=Rubripirellula lacrimiformis TaxID=1930273 RepID=A0A517NA09_9BACT|nr:hypothetical protein [Rubripirellula lacrimiformis]QDT03979.1 hypothetical protein K227x_23650 [Rubripirellula lacrimiformis]